jgi:hypothetical protein
MTAAAEGGERDFAPGAGLPAETRLDRLPGDLGHGNTPAPGFAAERGCQRFGKTDGGALHTCIIAYWTICRGRVILFHKPTLYVGTKNHLRPTDETDFAALLPLLTEEQRAWLRQAVARVYEGEHPWVEWLSA